MTDSLSVDDIQECANNIRKLEGEIRHIEDIMNSILCEIHPYSQDLDTVEFLHRISNYMQETRNICEDIDKFANKLETLSNELGCTALFPFFDFIVNLDIGIWWEQAYPIISQIAAVTGAVTGTAAITRATKNSIKWIRNKLQERQTKNEYAWIKLILSKEAWNISDLSQTIGLSDDEVKQILKGFGYIWDTKKMLYVSTDNTYRLKSIKLTGSNDIR